MARSTVVLEAALWGEPTAVRFGCTLAAAALAAGGGAAINVSAVHPDWLPVALAVPLGAPGGCGADGPSPGGLWLAAAVMLTVAIVLCGGQTPTAGVSCSSLCAWYVRCRIHILPTYHGTPCRRYHNPPYAHSNLQVVNPFYSQPHCNLPSSSAAAHPWVQRRRPERHSGRPFNRNGLRHLQPPSARPVVRDVVRRRPPARTGYRDGVVREGHGRSRLQRSGGNPPVDMDDAGKSWFSALLPRGLGAWKKVLHLTLCQGDE